MKDKIDTPVFIVFLVGSFVFACITFVLGIWVCDSSHEIDKQLTNVKVEDNYSEDNITADDLFKEEFNEEKEQDEPELKEADTKVKEESKSNTISQSDLIKKNNEIIESKKNIKEKKVDKKNTSNKTSNTKNKRKKSNTVLKNNSEKNRSKKSKANVKKQYYIQIIATSKKSVAKSEKNKYERKGYNVFLVPEKKGKTTIYKVRIGTFKTKEQAKKIAEKIAKEFKVKPWVL